MRFFEQKIVGMSPSVRLGAIRVIVTFVALVLVLRENFSSIAEVPLSWYWPQGFLRYIPLEWLGFLFQSPRILAFYKVILVLTLFCAMIGFRTRQTLFLAVVLYSVFLGSIYAFTKYVHEGLLPLFLMFFMIWIPSGEGLSVDQLIRKEYARLRLDDRPTSATGWSIFLIRSVLSLSFFQTGFTTLYEGEFSWRIPLDMKRFVIQDNLGVAASDFKLGLGFVHWPDAIWVVLASLFILSQFFYPLVLIFRRFRMGYPIFAMVLHSVFYAFHGTFYVDLIFLQLIFYDWDRLLGLQKLSDQDRRKAKPMSLLFRKRKPC